MEFVHIPDQWSSLLVVFPLLGAFLIPLVYAFIKNERFAPVVAFLTTAGGLVVSANVLMKVVAHGNIQVVMGGYVPPIGINWRIDIWGALLSLLIYLIGFLATVYSVGYVDKKWWVKYYSTMQVMIAGAVGVSLTGDLFNMFVFLEVASISAYILVSTEATETTLEASFKYLVLGSIATSLILLAIALLYGGYHTLNIYDLASKIGKYPILDLVAIALSLIGLGVEGAMFPLNSWLPDAHPSAPSPISAMLSGTLIKIGLIGIVRVLIIASSTMLFDKLLMFMLMWGVITAIWGELSALRQKDIKRLLAHSSSAQMGYIVSALSTFTPIGIAAAIIHMLVHALSKALLFMSSGVFIEKMNTREIEKLRGSGKDISGIMFAFGSLSLMGMPPLPGFFSKFLILLAVYSRWGWIPTFLILGAAAVEVFYYLWLIARVWGYQEKASHKANAYMTISLTLLGIVVVALGLMPGVMDYVVSSIMDLSSVIPYQLLWSFCRVGYGWVGIALSLLAFVPGLKDVVRIGGVAFGGYMLLLMLPNLSVYSFIALFAYIAISGLLISSIGDNKQGVKDAFMILSFTALITLLNTHNGFVLLYYWEIMSICAFFMFVEDDSRSFSGVVYTTFMTVFSYIFMVAIVVSTLYKGYDISSWAVAFAGVYIAVAMALKLGIFPFHVWADYGYFSAHPIVAGYLSGVVSKVAFMLLFIATVYIAIPSFINYLIILLGGITIVWAGYRAIVSRDLMGILAYSSISQMAYVLTGVLIGGAALSGAWLHALGHAVFETGLFIVAYLVFLLYKTTDIEKLRRKGVSPVVFYLATILFMSLAGIPPFSGFVSKWLLYQGAITGGYYLIAILMMVGSAMSMIYGMRFIIAISGKPEKGGIIMSIPLAIYGIITLILGIDPWIFFRYLKKALLPMGIDVPLTWKEFILGTNSGGSYAVMMVLALFAMSVVLFLVFYALAKPGKVEGEVFRGGAFYQPTDETLPSLSDMLWPMGHIGTVISYFDIWHEWIATATTTIADVLRGVYTGYLPDYALYISLTLLVVIQFVGI